MSKNTKKTQYSSPQRHKEHQELNLKDKRIKFAERQYQIDRLEIILDGLHRFLLGREAENALAVWNERRQDFRRATNKVIEAIIIDRLAKDETFYRKMKYYERLRRRKARLTYEQNLLSAEIEYLNLFPA